MLDDDVTADGAPFLVMELFEGETLDEHIVRSGGTLPPAEDFLKIGSGRSPFAATLAPGRDHRRALDDDE